MSGVDEPGGAMGAEQGIPLPEGISARNATIDDLDAIIELERSTFPRDAWSREMMAAELAAGHTHYIVLHAGAELVAYGGVSAPDGLDLADIQTLAVTTTRRRSGLGTALLRMLMLAARERGAREVLLEVRADNPAAQELYAQHGFAAIAVRPRYYQPDDVDAVVMRAEVHA